MRQLDTLYPQLSFVQALLHIKWHQPFRARFENVSLTNRKEKSNSLSALYLAIVLAALSFHAITFVANQINV